MERGRPKKLNSPDEVWDLFQGYLKWASDNPIRKMVFVGKDGNKDYELIDRPLSIFGFEMYCFENEVTISHYLENTNKSYEDFCTISMRVKNYIKEQQVSGGMSGLYNANLTARLNGLTDKQETKVTGEVGIFKSLDIDVPENNSSKQDS